MAGNANKPPQPEEAAGAPLTEAQIEQMQLEAEAQLIGWVMHMAGVDRDRAVEAINLAQTQEEHFGVYYNNLVDARRRGTHPGMGVRLWWPNGKTHTDLPCAKVLNPDNFLLKNFGMDFGAELGNYLGVICALTSPVGRAVLAAQGYRIEFTESPWPDPPRPKIIM